jgi:purine-nucleoside phosphorylase
MVLDCLEEMWLQKLLGSRSRFVLVGSMGSLADGIALRDIVIPNPALCAYYGFAGREIWQDAPMRESLLSALQSGGYKPKQYRHGSSYAVFDPHTDHKTYTTSLYDKTVTGVDCSEVFIGLEFAARKGIRVAAALYCSDTPAHHISDVGELEFERTARENDLLLNRVSADLLAETRGQT